MPETEQAKQATRLQNKYVQINNWLSRFETFLDDYNNEQFFELITRLESIDPLLRDSRESHEKIIDQIDDEDLRREQDEKQERFEKHYFVAVGKARKIITDRNQIVAAPPAPVSSGAINTVKLPSMNLPEFRGDYNEWHQFRDIFIAVIDKNETLSNVEKLYYLKGCLKGPASQVIQSVEVSNENYNNAWDLLKQRFENKRIIIDKQIQALFDLPTIAKESGPLLRKFVDELNTNLKALKALKEPVECWDRLLIYMLVIKIDNVSKCKWKEFTISKGNDELPNMAEFKEFLSNRCQLLESMNSVDNNNSYSRNSSKPFEKRKSDEKGSVNLSVITPSCELCKNTHFIYNCKKLLALPTKSRYEEIKRLKLCTNCLRNNHFSKNCVSRGCKICSKKHNTILHMEMVNNDDPPGACRSSDPQGSTGGSLEANNQVVATPKGENNQNQFLGMVATNYGSTVVKGQIAKQKCESQVLLSTAVVNIRDGQGNYHRARVLLDSGSQSNFLSENLAKTLNLSYRKIDLPVVGINEVVTSITRCVSTKIRSGYNNFEIELPFLIIPKITSKLPNFTIDPCALNIPPNISLADPNFNVPNEIDALLGASIFFDLLCVGQIKTGPGQPILQKSRLGWILSGSISSKFCSKVVCNLSTNMEISEQIERFWKLEEISDHAKFSQEEIDCEKEFTESLQFESGHYVVKLPVKENIDFLGDSQELARKRFYKLEQKLAKNPEMKKQYINFMREYESLGHMEKIPDSELEHKKLSQIYYLPHHGVIKDNSLTTKVRVVFDGSAKSNSGLALNDILKVGPKIQDDLFEILLRFRKHNYVLIADIEKMYRMVKIAPNQRDLQRIFWRENPEQSLCHYRLTTVTYGTASASFLAIRALQQVAHENKILYPIASKVILEDFYVDDLISGSDSIENAIKVKRDLSEILSNAGFFLRKWMSNERAIIDQANECEHDQQNYYITDQQSTKALGILWHATDDVLSYDVKNTFDHSRVTKRMILSQISQIFDPIGLVSPVTIRAKIILQQLWREKLDWNETIPQNILSSWMQFSRSIISLNDIKIHRHVLVKEPIEIQVHGFSDASQFAYGACVYLRSMDFCRNVRVRLLCAKSRVAPLNSESIPRLELCGALLLAQLVHKISNSMKLNVDKYFCWTDSTIVLSWLASEACTWQTFVSNRVSKIHKLCGFSSWRHIPTTINPADIISRSVNPEELIKNKLWFEGPQFLEHNIDKWPHFNGNLNETDIPEKRKTKLIFLNLTSDFGIFERYSSFHRLKCVVGYCIRFIRNSKKRVENRVFSKLTKDEINNAIKVLIKLMQSQEFGQEIHDLRKNQIVHIKSSLLPLSPFLDKEGIIRVGGRISKADITYDRKFPIVLASKHTLTKLIVKDEHHRQLHAGAQAVLASLRLNYWPINGRNTIRGILRKCMTCFRVKPTSILQKMGELPESRVSPTRPFYTSGVDYAGPFNIRDGKLRNRKVVKCYICLFICFSTKAVHMELVGDLTTDSHLNALKRFISRRGICSNLYSDNATTFVGANNELKSIAITLNESEETKTYLCKNNITWHHIPARSPHHGGIWEASVKSVKHHLKRVMGDSALTYEEFYTLITQIEAILNSRPLTPLTNDPNDLVALSPGHFLIGDYLTAIPQEDFESESKNRLSRYKHLQQMLQHFWLRWSREYLSTLQARTKWKKSPGVSVQIGSMVVLCEDNHPPQHWKLGRVVELHSGQDGVVRVLSIRTVNGIVRRAIQRVCLLPID
ncbi:uncharacterized protein [Leptinotarsa decemlineata]|uniref:uncharacterized protein n=1 Tax=Leptinotarsa decemlineata TaxID=7539 RepID=UPI003D3082CD